MPETKMVENREFLSINNLKKNASKYKSHSPFGFHDVKKDST